MGLLKKITKPISKVLDKIIPNEIKPALPFLSAAAPFLLPASGIMSGMVGRGLTMGGLNLASQLSQEGSEGDFSGLSALLAAATGAMTSPDAPQFFQGMQKDVPYKDVMTDTVISPTQDTGIMTSIKDAIGKGGETASRWLQTQGDILRPGGEAMTMKNVLPAIAVPASQGMGDLAMADARRALKDYERELASTGDIGSDEDRALAIRLAMEAGGHSEETIVETIRSLGYRQGGIVGLRNGGRIGFYNGGDTDVYDAESDMSQWKIGKYRPFKYTGAIDDLWKMNLEDGSPLEYIFKIGMTVRAPLIDVIRAAGKTAAETAKLIAAAGELGLDLTKSARELIGDVGSAGLEGIKEGLGHSDKFRWITKPYLAERLSGLSDAEARLSLQDTHIGEFRKDKDLINMLENKLMDEKVGESPDQISMEEVELYPGRREKTSRMSLMADGGMTDTVLPKGTEMDYRGGGMIPMGSKERADDVPARLSKNEFVMTADAVRAAGGGSVNVGAKRMYDLMHNLEARV